MMLYCRADDETIRPVNVFILGSEGSGGSNSEATAGPDVDDGALVKAAQHGDGEAFGVLVERYHAQVYALTARMCGADEADDLTQEVFVKALEALRRLSLWKMILLL